MSDIKKKVEEILLNEMYTPNGTDVEKCDYISDMLTQIANALERQVNMARQMENSVTLKKIERSGFYSKVETMMTSLKKMSYSFRVLGADLADQISMGHAGGPPKK